MRVSIGRCIWLSLPLTAFITTKAAAGGLEYVGAGTEAAGRGGAVTARADDPMVLYYNPAGLADLRGTQLMISANLALMNACVDPIGYYGWGVYNGGTPVRFTDPRTGQMQTLNLGASNTGPEAAFYTGKLDTVCMNENITPVPQLGFTIRLSERVGIGFGLMSPEVTPQGSWGGDGVIRDANGNLRPVPTRYMMLNSGTLGLFPTAGIGIRLAKWLRIGASFEWGIVNVDNTSMAALSAGTNPANDIIARVRATDWFEPAINASIHIVPIDSLDIVGAFRYQAPLNAPGTIDLTTGVYDPNAKVRTTTDQVLAVKQGMPWKLRGGIRYADRLVPRPTGTGQNEARGLHGETLHDPFGDERWDIEFDAEFQHNSANRDQIIDYAPNQTVQFETTAGAINSAAFPDPTRTYTDIGKHWRDQISLRLGGSYNILPGVFGIMAGAHYENRGVDPSYMQIDYWPVSRIGLHAGVIFRVARSIDFVAAYEHIFQETLVVAAPPNAPGEVISDAYKASGNNAESIYAIDKRVGFPATRGGPVPVLEENPPTLNPDGTARVAQNTTKTPQGQPPWIINSGTYRSSIDVVSMGVNLHF